MGHEYRPKHLTDYYRKIIEDFTNDLSPSIRDNIMRLLDTWEGKNSEIKLETILGKERTRELVNKLSAKEKPLDEQDERNLKDLFKESVTFD